jgi:hypothetical protein
MRREERRGVGEIFISFEPRKESRKVVGTCEMCEQFWRDVVIARSRLGWTIPIPLRRTSVCESI